MHRWLGFGTRNAEGERILEFEDLQWRRLCSSPSRIRTSLLHPHQVDLNCHNISWIWIWRLSQQRLILIEKKKTENGHPNFDFWLKVWLAQYEMAKKADTLGQQQDRKKFGEIRLRWKVNREIEYSWNAIRIYAWKRDD